MRVEVKHDKITVLERIDNYAIFEKEIHFPTVVVIKTSGKNHNFDTKIDAEGNIYEDLFVQIESISLDSFKLNEKYLHQKIICVAESGDSIITSYLGFNGETKLEFLEENTFLQILKG